MMQAWQVWSVVVLTVAVIVIAGEFLMTMHGGRD